MHVDNVGRNGDTVYAGINIANLINSFLRRDGGFTAIGAIDINRHILKNGETRTFLLDYIELS